MLSVKTILYPTDFSTNSETAFKVACALARDYDARLIILHVNPPPVALYTGEGVIPPVAEPDPQAILDRLHRIEPIDSTIRFEHQLVEGDEATEILRVAKESQAGLIVMGTHGRTGLTRLLLGSVAEKIMRKATCPVLTVKGAPVTAPTAKAGEEPAPREEVAAGSGMFGVWP